MENMLPAVCPNSSWQSFFSSLRRGGDSLTKVPDTFFFSQTLIAPGTSFWGADHPFLLPTTSDVPRRKASGKAWRSLGSPTSDTAAWGPPLMYQCGETVITHERGCCMSPNGIPALAQENRPLAGP